MMKIMSRSKIALMAVLVAVMMVMSMMAVSAAPVADAGSANEGYAAGHTVASLEDLQNAMKEVEDTGADVTATLTANIVLDPAEATTYVVGTDKTSAGKLIVTGGGTFGITVGTNAILHVKGNVQFENIILDRPTTAAVADYKKSSYIFVTEGKGIFGEGIKNENTDLDKTGRKTKINIAGSDLEVYSGYYMIVAANFANSATDVDSPKIVFGGKAKAENVAGRGCCTGATPKVTGTSTVTIQGEANVTNVATAGHFRPEATVGQETSLGGNAVLEMKGGTVQNLCFVGAALEKRGLANLAVDAKTRSQYTINIAGGKISNATTLFYFNKAMSFKGVDVTVNFGNAVYENRCEVGPWVIDAGASVTDCKVTANINGATFKKALYGAFIDVATAADTKVVLDIDLEYNIGKTDKVVFQDDVKFGAWFKPGATYSEYNGDIVVNIWPTNQNVKFTSTTRNEFYVGSELNAPFSKHTGDTTLKIYNKPFVDYNNKVFYGGSLIAADNAEHKGNSTVITPEAAADHINAIMGIYGGSKITKAGKHSGNSYVKVLAAAAVQSSAVGVLDASEGYVFGGSNLVGANAEHSGNSKVTFGEKTSKSTIESVLRHDTFGGSNVAATGAKHTGKSEVICEYSKIQGNINVYGGSYLGVTGATQTGASALTINERVGTSGAVINLYGGSYIKVAGAKHTGSSTFEMNKGVMGHPHGAGSYAAEAEAGAFAQGDVFYIINGGEVTEIPNIAGVNVNVDGDISVIITGGTIGKTNVKVFSTLNNDKSKSVCINGDLILKISGGTLKFDQIYHGSLNDGAVAGQDVVKGTYYAEFVGNGMKFESPVENSVTSFYPVGYNNVAANFAGSSLYIRYVGDFDCFNEKTLKYNFTSRVNHLTGEKILDYVQWTKGGTLATLNRGETVYRPMNGQTVTVSGIGANAKLGDYAVKSGDTLTWKYQDKEISVTYDALTKYNDFTEYKNDIKFAGATAATQTMAFSCGVAVANVPLSDAAKAQITTIANNYALVGTGIRLNSLAMRCQAKIFKAFLEGGAAQNGLAVTKVGMLVGKDAASYVYGSKKCINAVAWENGKIKVDTGKFAEDSKYDGFYLYQAVIPGYESNNAINADRAKTTVYFRGYIIVKDTATNVENIVYIDMPVENAGSVNYGKTLIEVASEAKKADNQLWYNGLGDNKKKIDDIIALGGAN